MAVSPTGDPPPLLVHPDLFEPHAIARLTRSLAPPLGRLCFGIARSLATKNCFPPPLSLPRRYMPADTRGDPIVQELNTRALGIARARGIPYVDLYTRVTDRCGVKYTDCPICAKHPCSFHVSRDRIARPPHPTLAHTMVSVRASFIILRPGGGACVLP